MGGGDGCTSNMALWNGELLGESLFFLAMN